jgi:mRNA interferase MazF
MVTPVPASIVVVEFPFSDLSASKLRPAVVICDAGRGDWLLCQITSNPHSDPNAVRITPDHLSADSLASLSFARPLKLFTASDALMTKRIATLKDDPFKEILLTTIKALQVVMPKQSP